MGGANAAGAADGGLTTGTVGSALAAGALSGGTAAGAVNDATAAGAASGALGASGTSGASVTSASTFGVGASLTGTAVSGAMWTAFGCMVWACCSRGALRGIVAGDQPNAGVTLAAAAATSPPVAMARQVWTARLASWMFSRNAISE
ncbi:hypothetical protein NK6_7079 [Bradyrhizobium diazoefficiens]|uniref:Uncharacterized protein n=1 Tax=Bradyrhizobium diazoefficiens TaxID=1355477 RepID=A0A0E3VW37_9BRAD|nr:hypothetical protein NK6_7079 [Bradyrhizobium diazoefficiens]